MREGGVQIIECGLQLDESDKLANMAFGVSLGQLRDPCPLEIEERSFAAIPKQQQSDRVSRSPLAVPRPTGVQDGLYRPINGSAASRRVRHVGPQRRFPMEQTLKSQTVSSRADRLDPA